MTKPTFEEIEKGIHIRYWNCPINFITNNIMQFIGIYDYCKSFTNVKMPAYDNLSNRFRLAMLYFESKYNEFLIDTQKG